MKTIINKAYQLFFLIAYRILLCTWYLRRPESKGVYIAVWYDGQILLIKNSYKRYFTLPGGGINKKETFVQAAARELREETGIRVDSQKLEFFGPIESKHEYKHDVVYFWEVELADKPTVKVDQREVIWASFMDKDTALNMEISPVVQRYLLEKQKNEMIHKI